MNSLQKSLVENGLAKEPKQKPKRHKKYTCRKCGADMVMIEGTNTMACSECKNFFVFDNLSN